MWLSTALLIGISSTVSVTLAANPSLLLNCLPSSKPGSCVLRSIVVQEKDVFGTAAQASSETNVTFENSQLDYLPEVIFNKFPRLEKLQASGIKLKKLSASAFSKSSMLKELDLSENFIAALPENVFGTCQNLAVINIAENRLHLLNNVELIGCSKLRQLNISSNRLIFMNWDPLEELRSLERIDLSNNLITALSIPKYLKKLIARNNHIHELTSDAGAIILMLEYLDVSKNRLQNVEMLTRFNRLTYIDLSYNRLLSVDFALFKNMRSLRELNLANNNIFTVSTSDTKPITLNLVNLSNNELTHLSVSDCRGIESTEKLLLDNNYLVNFNVTKGLSNFPRLRHVSLSNNDWACRDLEAIIAELKVKQVTISSKAESCAPHQVLKDGICCRDLGASFDELVLLKSEKLAQIQRSSTTRSQHSPTVIYENIIKMSTPVTVQVKKQLHYADNEQFDQSASTTLANRLTDAEARIKILQDEKSTLKASLERAQAEVKRLSDTLSRCQATVHQRSGQTVLID